MNKNDPTNTTDGPAEEGDRVSEDITRREVVKRAWVAPVFVAVNLPKGVYAKSAISPVATPAPGTTAPTGAPGTGAPTSAPGTIAPTSPG
jgi:hypothetical protein